MFLIVETANAMHNHHVESDPPRVVADHASACMLRISRRTAVCEKLLLIWQAIPINYEENTSLGAEFSLPSNVCDSAKSLDLSGSLLFQLQASQRIVRISAPIPSSGRSC